MEELRDRVATAELGGSQVHRARHVSRGRLLPRDRIASVRPTIPVPPSTRICMGLIASVTPIVVHHVTGRAARP